MPTIRDIWLPANNIIRQARRIINEGLKPFGLSSAEGNVLVNLMLGDETMTQEQLVGQMDVSKAAVSRAVDALVEKGYVVRRRAVGDKRFCNLLLTVKAQQAAADIEQIYNGVYQRALQNIAPHEFEALTQLLGRISKNFAGEESTEC